MTSSLLVHRGITGFDHHFVYGKDNNKKGVEGGVINLRTEKKLFLALNQIKKGFMYIESRRVPCGSEHAYRLPMNCTATDIERRIDTLVSATGCPIELIDRGGAVQVLVVEKDFPQALPFKVIDVKDTGLLMGYNRHGNPVYHPLNTHLLVGGASRSGKTEWLRSVIYQLYKQGYLIFISDLKGTSYFPFEVLPNINVVDNIVDGLQMLKTIVAEIDRRKEIIKRTRNRALSKTFQPIAFIVDEGAVFSPNSHEGAMKKIAQQCDSLIAYIGQQAREFRVFSILAYQRPDEKTINKQYKANIEASICFRTYDDYNSRIIMGKEGAERISPATPGRCIYNYDRQHTLQVPFVASDEEWERLLAPFKPEVLHGGSSVRSKPSPVYIDVSFESADRHDETVSHAQQLIRPDQEGVKTPPRARKRKPGTKQIHQPREGVVPNARRPKTHEQYSDEISE